MVLNINLSPDYCDAILSKRGYVTETITASFPKYMDSYGKNAIQIRMESKLPPETVMKLIESDKNLSFVIHDSDRDFSTTLPLDTFKKKVERLGIYL